MLPWMQRSKKSRGLGSGKDQQQQQPTRSSPQPPQQLLLPPSQHQSLHQQQHQQQHQHQHQHQHQQQDRRGTEVELALRGVLNALQSWRAQGQCQQQPKAYQSQHHRNQHQNQHQQQQQHQQICRHRSSSTEYREALESLRQYLDKAATEGGTTVMRSTCTFASDKLDSPSSASRSRQRLIQKQRLRRQNRLVVSTPPEADLASESSPKDELEVRDSECADEDEGEEADVAKACFDCSRTGDGQCSSRSFGGGGDGRAGSCKAGEGGGHTLDCVERSPMSPDRRHRRRRRCRQRPLQLHSPVRATGDNGCDDSGGPRFEWVELGCGHRQPRQSCRHRQLPQLEEFHFFMLRPPEMTVRPPVQVSNIPLDRLSSDCREGAPRSEPSATVWNDAGVSNNWSGIVGVCSGSNGIVGVGACNHACSGDESDYFDDNGEGDAVGTPGDERESEASEKRKSGAENEEELEEEVVQSGMGGRSASFDCCDSLATTNSCCASPAAVWNPAVTAVNPATSAVNPAAASAANPTAASIANPTAASAANPAAASAANPTAASAANPTAASIANPTAASAANPTAASIANPTAASTANPTASAANATATGNSASSPTPATDAAAVANAFFAADIGMNGSGLPYSLQIQQRCSVLVSSGVVTRACESYPVEVAPPLQPVASWEAPQQVGAAKLPPEPQPQSEPLTLSRSPAVLGGDLQCGRSQRSATTLEVMDNRDEDDEKVEDRIDIDVTSKDVVFGCGSVGVSSLICGQATVVNRGDEAPGDRGDGGNSGCESSCSYDIAKSSGFTRLLQTLDKAQKRQLVVVGHSPLAATAEGDVLFDRQPNQQQQYHLQCLQLTQPKRQFYQHVTRQRASVHSLNQKLLEPPFGRRRQGSLPGDPRPQPQLSHQQSQLSHQQPQLSHQQSQLREQHCQRLSAQDSDNGPHFDQQRHQQCQNRPADSRPLSANVLNSDVIQTTASSLLDLSQSLQLCVKQIEDIANRLANSLKK